MGYPLFLHEKVHQGATQGAKFTQALMVTRIIHQQSVIISEYCAFVNTIIVNNIFLFEIKIMCFVPKGVSLTLPLSLQKVPCHEKSRDFHINNTLILALFKLFGL